jgi:hypothetical protein
MYLYQASSPLYVFILVSSLLLRVGEGGSHVQFEDLKALFLLRLIQPLILPLLFRLKGFSQQVIKSMLYSRIIHHSAWIYFFFESKLYWESLPQESLITAMYSSATVDSFLHSFNVIEHFNNIKSRLPSSRYRSIDSSTLQFQRVLLEAKGLQTSIR